MASVVRENEADRGEDWPADGLEAVPECPVCGSGERELLYDGLTDRVFFCAPGRWTLHRCKSCRSGYLDPRPTPETIHLAYKLYYTHEPTSQADNPEVLGAFHRFRRALANGYRNWRFGTELFPASKLGVLFALALPGQRELLEREFRNLGRPRPGLRLLDVGFGSGAFLEAAKSVGWEVSGADPDPIAVEAASQRGLDVRQGGPEVFADALGSFDAITLSHVIEHVHNPREFIRTLYDLLKPRGILWIDTPNIDSLGHRYFKRNWINLDPPRHLILFNWSVLEDIISDAGFVSAKRVTYHNSYLRHSAASKAIIDGSEPFKWNSPTIYDHMTGLLFYFLTRLDCRRAEFVTLTAFKPHGGAVCQ